jgi:hypothetical protein
MCRFVTALKAAIVFTLAFTVPGFVHGATDNSGLGPFALRSFFPPTLPFLDFVPEQAITIPESSFRVTYQYSVSNTFFNTESPARPGIADPITPEDVERGLTPDDFQPVGYGLFIDVEVERHLISLRYGLEADLEVGIDLAWVSFGSGQLDSAILETEEVFDAVNENLTIFEPGQFAYYVARNGEFIHATKEPFEFEAQDPVLNLKWNLGPGGDFLPAFSLKLSYKVPLDSSPEEPASFVNSGEADYHYSLIFSKRFGRLVTHFQFGKTKLNVPKNQFESGRTFRMFGVELQSSENNAYVLQMVSQSRLFKLPVDLSPDTKEFNFSRPTDLVSLGVKHGRKGFLFSAGLVEDFNSAFNESDITLFLELGWQW